MTKRQTGCSTASPNRFGIHRAEIRKGPVIFLLSHSSNSSRDSAVSHYVLDDRGTVVRFPAEARDFYLLCSIQTDYGIHPASYSVRPGGTA